MGVKTDAVLNHIASVIVNANQTCIASAAASFRLDIDKAEEVIISNIDVDASAGVSNTSCKQIVSVENLLDLKDLNLPSKTEANIRATLEETITIDVVSSCVSIAVASIQIRLGTIKNTVEIKNVNIKQIARAKIKECIQRVRVKNGSTLGDFLLENEAEEITETPECIKAAKKFRKVSSIVGGVCVGVSLIVFIASRLR